MTEAANVHYGVSLGPLTFSPWFLQQFNFSRSVIFDVGDLCDCEELTVMMESL